MSNLKTRVAKLEVQKSDELGQPGIVLVVGNPHALTEAEVAELARLQAVLRPGGAVVLLPDNGRGDR